MEVMTSHLALHPVYFGTLSWAQQVQQIPFHRWVLRRSGYLDRMPKQSQNSAVFCFTNINFKELSHASSRQPNFHFGVNAQVEDRQGNGRGNTCVSGGRRALVQLEQISMECVFGRSSRKLFLFCISVSLPAYKNTSSCMFHQCWH